MMKKEIELKNLEVSLERILDDLEHWELALVDSYQRAKDDKSREYFTDMLKNNLEKQIAIRQELARIRQKLDDLEEQKLLRKEV